MTVGFLGLGEIGGPMSARLAAAGQALIVFDPVGERLAAAPAGAARAASAEVVVDAADVVMTSLPSAEAFVEVADRLLLNRARAGQVFVDFGTTFPGETARLAAAFAARGAALVDAPVSGGPQGAAAGTLYIFLGGAPEAVAVVRPMLTALGPPERATHCGPPGSGQIAKGVNQLAMGLGAAAFLEALAFAARCGLDPATARRAVADPGSTEPWRVHFERVAAAVAQGGGPDVGVKFRELPYFLREARERGFALPLTERLFAVCDAGERVVTDDHRPAPSYWRELTKS